MAKMRPSLQHVAELFTAFFNVRPEIIRRHG